MAVTTLKRSMDYLRAQGFSIVEKVERWNHHGQVKNDLFGFIDVLALGYGHTIGVQATTMSCIDKHLDIILKSAKLIEVKKSGWIIELHGWRKLQGRWKVQVIPITSTQVTDILPKPQEVISEVKLSEMETQT